MKKIILLITILIMSCSHEEIATTGIIEEKSGQYIIYKNRLHTPEEKDDGCLYYVHTYATTTDKYKINIGIYNMYGEVVENREYIVSDSYYNNNSVGDVIIVDDTLTEIK